MEQQPINQLVFAVTPRFLVEMFTQGAHSYFVEKGFPATTQVKSVKVNDHFVMFSLQSLYPLEVPVISYSGYSKGKSVELIGNYRAAYNAIKQGMSEDDFVRAMNAKDD